MSYAWLGHPLGLRRRDPISHPMHVTIKTPEEQEKMRIAGRLAAEVLDMIAEHVVPGVTTEELDRLCHDGEVAWLLPEGPKPYWRGRITSLRYEFAQ